RRRRWRDFPSLHENSRRGCDSSKSCLLELSHLRIVRWWVAALVPRGPRKARSTETRAPRHIRRDLAFAVMANLQRFFQPHRSRRVEGAEIWIEDTNRSSRAAAAKSIHAENPVGQHLIRKCIAVENQWDLRIPAQPGNHGLGGYRSGRLATTIALNGISDDR